MKIDKKFKILKITIILKVGKTISLRNIIIAIQLF